MSDVDDVRIENNISIHVDVSNFCEFCVFVEEGEFLQSEETF